MKTTPFTWLDSKRFLAWLYPPGHFIFYWWIIAGVLVALSIFDSSIQNNTGRKIELFVMGFFAICSGIWFLIGTYQVMFNDIKKLFIVYKLEVNNNTVDVGGYYFKHDKFLVSDIAQLNSFKIKDVWKRVTSFFSFADDNYKLLLRDGRCFYFQGATIGVKEMLIELSGINEIESIGTFTSEQF